MIMYKELTAQDLISLLQDRQKFRAKQLKGAQVEISGEDKLKGAQGEISYLLGRITAHRQGIRPISQRQ